MQHQPPAIVHVQLIRYDRMTDFTVFSVIFVTASQISETIKIVLYYRLKCIQQLFIRVVQYMFNGLAI